MDYKSDELLNIMTNGENKEFSEDEKKLIELVKEGLTQEEIGRKLNTTKFTINRKIKALKEKYPDLKLETAKRKKKSEPQEEKTPAAAVAQKPQEATKQEQANISPQTEKKPENEPLETPQKQIKKQVFSFRANSDLIATWKSYVTVTGQTMENIGSAALCEYIENHKNELTDKQKIAFEALKG